MAKGVKKSKDEGGDGGAISNVPSGEKIMEFVERVESLDGDLATEKGEFMSRCKVIQGDKKEVYKEAKAAGFNKKALKGIVSKRKLEAEIEDISADLEGDDGDAYSTYCLALEKLAA